MPQTLPPAVAQYLQRHHVMTLATQGPDGPWAAAVFYAAEGVELLFLSSPSSRHCRHLAQDARCAATIQEDYSEWAQIKGVQLEGRVRELRADDARLTREHYARKFPIVGALGGAPAAIAEALQRVHWYRLVPERLYFIDNSRGFGHREAIDLGRGLTRG
jgi:uncharacterized protein YhbP (UPF0306 family)